MDWDEADENRWDALQRIVALLLSLAGLVERLAAAGLPLDSRLLLAIGHAELAAKAFIFDLDLDDCDLLPALPGGPQSLQTPGGRDGHAGHILRLAASLRQLALSLALLMLASRRSLRRRAGPRAAAGELARTTAAVVAAWIGLAAVCGDQPASNSFWRHQTGPP